MNTSKAVSVFPWSADLEASRDVVYRDRDAFAMVFGWLEQWRRQVGCEASRDACKRF